MEIFTKWQGFWLLAIGAWDSSYKPQLLKYTDDNSLCNENIIVKRVGKGSSTQVIGIAKNTLAGRIKFRLSAVEKLPANYSEIREESLKFTNRHK